MASKVQPGDIWQLGRHRLMCGDATDKNDVAQLFAGRQPTIVVTSPPYAKQRAYDRPIVCWDALMLGALDGHRFDNKVQLLIWLGPTRVRGEVSSYWLNWICLMRQRGWRHVGQYIWDKLLPQFGENHGICRSEHEFIFHLNKVNVLLNKNVKNIHAGKMMGPAGYREADGIARLRPKCLVQNLRAHGSVFRMYKEMANKTNHPAVAPVKMSQVLINCWKKRDSLAYDPFCGSGTTLLASEQEGVDGFGMEISPVYCQIAIDRWNKAYPAATAQRIV